jgi:hypothetical protein
MWWKRTGGSELRHLLLDEWDPIGVRDVPEAQDEYDSYLGQIGARLRQGSDAEGIASYLDWAEFEHMGLDATAAARMRNRGVGSRLCSWYAEATAG